MIDTEKLNQFIKRSTTYTTAGAITREHFDRAEFAKLIVEDCAQAAEASNRHYVSGYLANAVKRRWGMDSVKETE